MNSAWPWNRAKGGQRGPRQTDLPGLHRVGTFITAVVLGGLSDCRQGVQRPVCHIWGRSWQHGHHPGSKCLAMYIIKTPLQGCLGRWPRRCTDGLCSFRVWLCKTGPQQAPKVMRAQDAVNWSVAREPMNSPRSTGSLDEAQASRICILVYIAMAFNFNDVFPLWYSWISSCC